MQKASQWIHLAEKPICNYLIYVIYVNKKKFLINDIDLSYKVIYISSVTVFIYLVITYC